MNPAVARGSHRRRVEVAEEVDFGERIGRMGGTQAWDMVGVGVFNGRGAICPAGLSRVRIITTVLARGDGIACNDGDTGKHAS